MNNYGSEKVLNCNSHSFNGISGWYQQESNLPAWEDCMYQDTYNYFNQTPNMDYVSNFESNEHTKNQYSHQQNNCNNFTQFNYNTPSTSQMHITERRQTATNTFMHHHHQIHNNNSGTNHQNVSYQNVKLPDNQQQLSPNNLYSSHESLCIDKGQYNIFDYHNTASPGARSESSSSSSGRSVISTIEYTSHKSHIHAEKKRRQNIKQGFVALRELIYGPNPGTKISNARLLQKSYDHIKQIKNQREIFDTKIKSLKLELRTLNQSISSIQETLPTSGASMDIGKRITAADLYQNFVKEQSKANWKFWIFAKIFNPVVQAIVSADIEEGQGSLECIDEKCPIIKMRLAASNMLREVSLNTNLFTEKSTTLNQEIQKLINHE
uniref:CSON002379 protein n=1 Tax=Culicoides sonorensis TaxID=179676 RepID=A0A336LLU7_CULSO